MDLIEAEDIKKRWQEYTEELYKKDLHNPENHGGVITDLEPDILECDVQWALGSSTTNKASGGNEIAVQLFSIYKFHMLQYIHRGTSLVVQWIGILLPVQGTRVQSLVQEDSTCN